MGISLENFGVESQENRVGETYFLLCALQHILNCIPCIWFTCSENKYVCKSKKIEEQPEVRQELGELSTAQGELSSVTELSTMPFDLETGRLLPP